MALTLQTQRVKPISLDEYLDYIDKHVDPEDQASIIDSGQQLYALSLDQGLLVRTLNRNLETVEAPDRKNPFYSAHSFILGQRGHRTVRANIWPVVKKFAAIPHRVKHVDHVYAYSYPHDHNFDFVTVGWYGPGYVTDIYEYDHVGTQRPGERVPLRFLERTTLPCGKTMMFRKGQDVHVQLPPESISVSLNLLVRSSYTGREEQFAFDVENQRIDHFVTGSEISRMALTIKFAGILGNARTGELLREIAERSEIARLRAASYEALHELEGGLAPDAERLLKRDRSPFARALEGALLCAAEQAQAG